MLVFATGAASVMASNGHTSFADYNIRSWTYSPMGRFVSARSDCFEDADLMISQSPSSQHWRAAYLLLNETKAVQDRPFALKNCAQAAGNVAGSRRENEEGSDGLLNDVMPVAETPTHVPAAEMSESAEKSNNAASIKADDDHTGPPLFSDFVVNQSSTMLHLRAGHPLLCAIKTVRDAQPASKTRMLAAGSASGSSRYREERSDGSPYNFTAVAEALARAEKEYLAASLKPGDEGLEEKRLAVEEVDIASGQEHATEAVTMAQDERNEAVAAKTEEEDLALQEVLITERDRRAKLATELEAKVEKERRLAEAVAKAAAEAEEERLMWAPEKLVPSDEVTQQCLQAAAGWGPTATQACLTAGMR